jgi:preprotein translocase subunit SecF
MRLFREPNIDFLSRRYLFVALSLVLIVAGAVSLLAKGGFKFGIDFRGGTLVYVKFRERPDLDRLRSGLTEKGLSVSTLQPFEEGAGQYELKIDLNLTSEEEGALEEGRSAVVETLHQIYGAEEGKPDLNNVGPETLADRLLASNSLATAGLSTERISEAAQKLIEFRDSPPQSGLVKDFSELTSVEGVDPVIISALREETYLGAFSLRGVGAVGPKIGRELQWQAVKATLFALGGMLIYIAFRFEWIYGIAAVAAVFHDVLITLGFFSLFDREIELTVIAALLTLVGYSMNDTIVIFDRVRENRKLVRRKSLEELLNLSVNQTLARTVLTSGLTFVAVLFLFLFGGEVLRGFSFALVVGIIVGTYSSVFIASPILLWWQESRTARAAAGGRRRR